MNKVFVVAVLGAALSFWMSSPSNAQSDLVVKWGPWSNWTDCSVTCGRGEMTRERRCITPGVPERRCLRLRRRECAKRRCPVLDETPGMMSTATSTSTEMSTSMPTPEGSLNTMGGDIKPGDGTVTMPTPEGMTDMKPDGAPDLNVTTEGMPDTRPTPEGMPDTKDYFMSPWGEWSLCEAQCGGGMRYRTRDCADPNEVPECENAEGQECNTQRCSDGTPTGEPGVTEDVQEDVKPTPEQIPDTTPTPEGTTNMDKDYFMSPWGEWSLCEAQCGGGMRYRTRECADPSEVPECENAEGQKCNTQTCSDGAPTGEPGVTEDAQEDVKPTPEPIPDTTPTPEDYSMAPWSEWSICEAKCGGGMQYRARQCEEPSGRPECEDAEGRICNTIPCGIPIPTGEPPITDVPEEGPDMMYTSWSSWTPCSTSCGGGMRYRVRECNKLNGHPDCEDSVDETCNTQKCSELTSKAPKHNGREARQRARELRLLCGSSRTEASIHTFVTAISPGFPNDYPGGLDCMWTVVAPRGTRVEIVIDVFEASVGDKLTLLEGRPKEMPYREARITTLTRSIDQGATYSSIGRYLTVRLQTKMNTMGGKYSIRFRAISTKLEDEEDHENPETAPEEETWYKIIRLLLTWIYRGKKGM